MHPLDELELRIFALTGDTGLALRGRTFIEQALDQHLLALADVTDMFIEFQGTHA